MLKQAYWLFAMRAAVKAGWQQGKRTRRATARTCGVADKPGYRRHEGLAQGTHNIGTGEMSRRQPLTLQGGGNTRPPRSKKVVL